MKRFKKIFTIRRDLHKLKSSHKKRDSHKWLQVTQMIVNKSLIGGLRVVHTSSNVNEAIKTISNFFMKKFPTHKPHTSEQKQKRQHFYAHKKHLRGRTSLVRLFAPLCFLCFLCFLGLPNLFVKKIKRLKTALLTSFTLLLLVSLLLTLNIFHTMFYM